MTFDEYISEFNMELNDQQLSAIKRINGATLLLAVPGSGKTTTIIARIGYMVKGLGITPESILTISYTRSTAASMREKYEKMFGDSERLEFRTIHGLCAKILSYFEYTTGRRVFRLIEKDSELLKIIRPMYTEISETNLLEAEFSTLTALVSYHRNMLSSKDDIKKDDSKYRKFYDFYFAFKKYKSDHKIMDHDDQLEYAYTILKTYPDILAHFQRQYKYINVDEAQDTSKLQHLIIRLLAKDNIFMVGDEDQSIYGFRAAYPQILLDFKEMYPGSEILLMETNYRSTKKIVDFANAFIKHNSVRYDKEMNAVKTKGVAPKLITLHDFSNLSSYLVSLVKNTETQTAILYRNSDNALPVISAFKKHSIDFNILGGDDHFTYSKAVQDIFNMLTFINDPHDEQLFLKIYYLFRTGMSRENAEKAISLHRKNRTLNIIEHAAENDLSPYMFLSRLKSLVKDIRHCSKLNSFDALRFCADKLCHKGTYILNDSSDNHKLNVLLTIAKEYPDHHEFMQHIYDLCSYTAEKKSSRDNLITLSTIHSSKGLEFDRVIIIDTKSGTLPSLNDLKLTMPKFKDLYEEERRLYYVAITRAMRELLVITSNRENGAYCDHSTFIYESFFPSKKTKASFNRISHISPPKKGIKILPKKKTLTEEEQQNLFAKLKIGAILDHAVFGKCSVVTINGDVMRVKLISDKSIKPLHIKTVIEAGLIKSIKLPDEL